MNVQALQLFITTNFVFIWANFRSIGNNI